MKKRLQKLLIVTLGCLLLSPALMAGNEQRAGSAGASELLINPWARSSGWGSANVGSVQGLEALYQNIAGTAFTRRTELIFTNSQYLVGSGININNFGFSQKIGEVGVLSVGVMTMNFGDIDITTEELPEGGLGTYKVSYNNIQLAYAQEFSNSIYGGMSVKIINEGLPNANAMGFALDAGIQYVTGIGKDKLGNRKRDNLRFGITMKNVGTTMKFTGDGMSFIGQSQWGTNMTVEQRSAEFELPSLIKIGASYYINLDAKTPSDAMMGEETADADELISNHQLIIAANFTSNSFTRDQFHFGLEYGFKNLFFLRGGYVYEKGMFEYTERNTVFTGPSAGLSVHIPMNNSGSVIAIDYSYRDTNPFAGVHTIGARISL
ncbi:MAG: PorV/PorQ family protein [Bacteroidales bacterium]